MVSYILFNHLEKNKIFLSSNEISKKILICLYPIIPSFSSKIFQNLFDEKISIKKWPIINLDLLEDNMINLPIQIQGKLVTTINTNKDYNEKDLLEQIYKIDKVSKKISDKEILKIINVQNKIINIITK